VQGGTANTIRVVFGKKLVDPRSLSEAWSVSHGVRSGKPLVARFNKGLKQAAGHPSFPIQIGVAVPLKSPNDQGMPTNEEAEQLNAIEDELMRLAGGRAIIAGVITTSGMREFVLYTSDGAWIPQFDQDLKAAIPHHDLQVMAQRDENWNTYRTFVK
jgi:hypothetical protein